jgi:hypothetical protein
VGVGCVSHGGVEKRGNIGVSEEGAWRVVCIYVCVSRVLGWVTGTWFDGF